MGFRLSKIYTRTGDAGTTGMADGSRLDKNHERVEAIGRIDELNSALGILRSHKMPESIDSILQTIQNHLFELGGELALPGQNRIQPDHIHYLEEHLDQLNDQLAPLKEFILPGGSQAAAWCHFVRTECRKAERQIITLHQVNEINAPLLAYINRLSDFFFVLARHLNKVAQVEDVLWQRE